MSYDAETGVFTWREGRRKGQEAGYNSNGYRGITPGFMTEKRKRYYAHRLAWFYVHGFWPPAEIDHINGDRADNRLANLRLATRAQQGVNSPRPSDALGFRGTWWNAGRKKWQAAIAVNGSRLSLGTFLTRELAAAAYQTAAALWHGAFRKVATL